MKTAITFRIFDLLENALLNIALFRRKLKRAFSTQQPRSFWDL